MRIVIPDDDPPVMSVSAEFARLAGSDVKTYNSRPATSDELCLRIQDADVVMMLRIQQERQGKTLMPNTREYSRYFGLNPVNLKFAKPDAMVMHPGPINRGVEMSSYVVDGDQSHILKQVENGVAVRMAMLYHVCGGELE